MVLANATDDSVVLVTSSGNILAEVVCGNSAAGITTSVVALPVYHSTAETPAPFECDIGKL